jgi:hypothetical protein
MKNPEPSQKSSGISRYLLIILGVIFVLFFMRNSLTTDGEVGPNQDQVPSASPFADGTVSKVSGDESATPAHTPERAISIATPTQAEINLGEGLCTYYSSSSGDQSGSGGFSDPFRTILEGVEILEAGDVLCVRDGTYNEIVKVSNSGTPTDPITIRVYPGELPVIDGRAGVDCINCGLPEGAVTGTDPVSGKGFTYQPLVGIEGDYVHLEGFTITRSLGRCVQVWREDHSVTGTVIRDNTIHDCRNEAILLENLPDQTMIEKNDISLAGSFATYSRDSRTLDWPGAVSVISGTNTTIRENVIHENWTEGVIVGRSSSHTVFEGNILYDNYALQLYIHAAEDVFVQGNLIYHTQNPEFFRGDNPSSCIVITSAEPQFNTGDVNGIRVFNNIITGCSTNVAFWGGEGLINDVIVAHNTLAEAYDPIETPVGLRVGNPSGVKMLDVLISNNIVLQSSGELVIEHGHSGVVFENNLWSRDEISARAASPGDVIGDPRLAKQDATLERGAVTPDWYKLTSTSPAIAAGSVRSEVAQDFFGQIRDSQPDIGAHEFVE